MCSFYKRESEMRKEPKEGNTEKLASLQHVKPISSLTQDKVRRLPATVTHTQEGSPVCVWCLACYGTYAYSSEIMLNKLIQYT